MMVDRKIERHFLYWVCAAITLLGMCLIVLSFNIQIFSSEIRSIGTTLCSIGIIGFIFQYYFHTSLEIRLEETIRLLEGSIKPEVAIAAERVGIKRILTGRYEFDKVRLDLYNKANNVSWLSVVPSLPAQYNMGKEIAKSLERGTNFRFLAWGDDRNIQATVAHLTKIKNDNKGPGKVEIKCYNEEPKWYIQIIDDTIYAQPYLYDVSIGKTPMFEMENGGDCYEYFLRHFESVWNKAKPIDEFLRVEKKLEEVEK
jgi:hypothetical protein